MYRERRLCFSSVTPIFERSCYEKLVSICSSSNVRASIRKIVEYLHFDERRHSLDGREDNHIFRNVMRVAEHFFPGQFEPAEEEEEEVGA